MPYVKLGSFGKEQGKNSYIRLNVGELSLGKEMLLQPGSQVRSINFSSTAGFQLLYDGTATFNDVNMRGTFATGVAGEGSPYIVIGEVGATQYIKFYTDVSGEAQPPMLRSTLTDAGSWWTIGTALYGGVVNATYGGYGALSINSSASDGHLWPTASLSAFGDVSTTKAYLTLEGNARATLSAQTAAYGSVDFVVDGGANQHIIWSSASTSRWYFPTGQGHIQAFGDYHVLAGDGTAALPSFSTYNDPNSGMYAYGADKIGISTGGTARVVIDSDGITVASGIFIAGSVGANDYMQISEASDYARFVLDNAEYFRVNKGTLQAHDGTSGLVEIFPKTYIAAGSVQTASITLDTTETEYGSQTIACEYANQPVLVSVQVTMRVIKSDDLVYAWLRAGINGTAKGAQVPLIDSVTGSSRYQMISTEWTEEVTADGSGNVTVGCFAKVESGTAGSTVVQVTYRVERC
jgi:hypothetical protein